MEIPPGNEHFVVRDLGRLSYRDAWNVQHGTHAAVASGAAPPTLLLVEHPPVVTFGKKGGRENLRVPAAALERRGFDLVDVERGGDVTYHGPGQLVGYPVFRVGRRVQSFLRALEAVMVATLAEFGVAAEGSPGYAGVWVGNDKVVAIGVAIKRDVSFHGFAMNVATDLSHFDTIVPCGLVGKGVASLRSLTGHPWDLDDVKPVLVRRFREVFGARDARDPASRPERVPT